jgi:hypothetical protein
MAEIKDLEKSAEEGELADEALDVSGGVGCHASTSFATVLNVDPEKTDLNVNPSDSKDSVGAAQICRF